MPEDTDFKNSVRLGLVDAIEQFALQKLLRDRDVSKCVPILRMAWELQAIVHEDREKRIKAQIESIFQDESIKNPVVFVNIGAGHAHMQNDYDSKEYHVRSKQDPLTKIAPSFVGYFFNELIKGKLTEEQIRKIILNRIIFPEICNLLYQGGITESSQWLTIANIFDSMPLERTELMFQEVLENLEPEADFERFLKDIFIWLAENEVTQEKVDAIQKKLEKKLSEPSSAQGNIKEGSGINPGLLPAAALGLFRKRAITAVIDSAA